MKRSNDGTWPTKHWSRASFGGALVTASIWCGVGGTLAAQSLSPHPGNEIHQRQIERAIPLDSGQTVHVRHREGDLRVVGTRGDEVRLFATVVVRGPRAREFAEAVDVAKERVDGAVVLSTVFPEREDGVELSYDVTLELELPADRRPELFTEFGDLEARELRAGLRAETRNGDVALLELRGALDIRALYGDVSLSRSEAETVNIDCESGAVILDAVQAPTVALTLQSGSLHLRGLEGSLNLRGSNGDLRVTDLHGSIDVEGPFQDLDASGVDGDVRFSSRNGRVTVRGASGAASVSNTFGPVSLAEIGGSAEASTSNASITLESIAGPARVECQFGNVFCQDLLADCELSTHSSQVRLQKVRGSVTLEGTFTDVDATQLGADCRVANRTGTIFLRDVRGLVHVDNSFGSVRLDRVHGPVVVHNESGNIDATELTHRGNGAAINGSSGKSVDLACSFGTLRLHLPHEPDLALKAEALTGHIDCGYQGVEIQRKPGRESCQHVFGEGTGKFTLRVDGGDIDIRLEPGR